MPTANRTNLHSLAEREFRRLTESPQPASVPRNFKGLNLRLSRFDPTWDRKRGAAARLTSVLLREDADSLRQRVCQDAKALKTYGGAVDWLQREAQYLRKVAALQETAVARLNAVLTLCRAQQAVE